MAKKTWLKAIHTDVRNPELLHRIPKESCDVAVFSPPYKRAEGHSEQLMNDLGRVLAHVLKPGGIAFMNFGQLKADLARPYKSRDAVLEGSSGLLHTGQTIIWAKSMAMPTWKHKVAEALKILRGKTGISRQLPMLVAVVKTLAGPPPVLQIGHYTPLNTKKVLNYGFEFLFTFYKNPMPDLDRLSIGVQFTDKTNLKRGTRGKNGDLHCAGDVWWIPYSTTGKTKKKKHKYEFPEELVRRCLLLSGKGEGATVFEPFLGSGTTPVVGKELGMNCWATEVDLPTLKGAEERYRRA